MKLACQAFSQLAIQRLPSPSPYSVTSAATLQGVARQEALLRHRHGRTSLMISKARQLPPPGGSRQEEEQPCRAQHGARSRAAAWPASERETTPMPVSAVRSQPAAQQALASGEVQSLLVASRSKASSLLSVGPDQLHQLLVLLSRHGPALGLQGRNEGRQGAQPLLHSTAWCPATGPHAVMLHTRPTPGPRPRSRGQWQSRKQGRQRIELCAAYVGSPPRQRTGLPSRSSRLLLRCRSLAGYAGSSSRKLRGRWAGYWTAGPPGHQQAHCSRPIPPAAHSTSRWQASQSGRACVSAAPAAVPRLCRCWDLRLHCLQVGCCVLRIGQVLILQEGAGHGGGAT